MILELVVNAQSTFTHYFSLSGWPDICSVSGTLKKGPKYGLQIAGCKKQGHCYWSLLFLNNNNPVFLHPAFCNPYFRPFFQGHKPIPKIVGADYRAKGSTEAVTEFEFLP